MKFHYILLTLLIAGCMQTTQNEPAPLYNESYYEVLENLSMPRNALYEIAGNDLIGELGSNFSSDEVSVLGVMLGDTRESVIARLGTADIEYQDFDRTVTNLEYGKKINLSGETGVTYSLREGKVTRIALRSSFNEYLVGNTSIGQSKDYLYSQLDLPDYQDFTRGSGFSYKIFYYVEQGLEFYLRRDVVEIIVLVEPREFKGVDYVTEQVEVSPGVYTNVTLPVPR